MLRTRFPQVHLIANPDNRGFATANNQALRTALTDCGVTHFLLLNPDTVVETDTLAACVEFFLTHPDCGGLGVKMINGEGKYLKESKRGFPSPEASFFKISGLVRLFPHHPRIAAYYMGHLPDDQTNRIDILPGAFLMVSREALEKVGLLDESYFMYGEDIDFSWRIRLAGYQNYYYPEVRIIHYKGESTKRGSMNYVYTFYNAMSIFVRHYFTGKNARLFNALIHVAIWSRAALSFIRRILTAIALPIADFLAAFAGFVAIKQLWSSLWVENVNYYPQEYTFLVIPIYILILMASSWLYGGYVKPVKLSRIVKGMAVGGALLLLFYSLLDESLRYSRALLLLGCVSTLISTLAIRALLSAFRIDGFDLRPHRPRKLLIVGSAEESSRVQKILSRPNTQLSTLRIVSPDTGSQLSESSARTPGLNSQLPDAICLHKPDEVVFCDKDIPIQSIIDLMTTLPDTPAGRRQVEFKIAPSSTDFVIGATRIHSTEDLFTDELNTLASPLNRRNKRLLDFSTSLFLLLLSPVIFWLQKNKRAFFPHCLQVLTGRKTWVGEELQAIFTPEQAIVAVETCNLKPETIDRLRLRYHRNYRLTTDLLIISKNLLNI